MVGMQDQNFKYFVNPTVFTVTTSMTIINNIVSNLTGNAEQQIRVQPVNISLCSDYYNSEDLLEKNMVFSLNLFYCPEHNAAYMQGYWGSPSYVAFRISFNNV